jgi:hypothetical protein
MTMPEAANLPVPVTGLSFALPEGLSIEEWAECGRRLFVEMRKAEDRSTLISWWVGDWWAFGSGNGGDGKPRYGARAQAVAEGIFGSLAFQTCRNLGSIARKIEVSRRRDVLPFTHHAEVASLAPADADALLDKAVAERLSSRQLRKEVMRHRIAIGDLLPREDDDPVYTGILAIARAWNRETVEARQGFYELAEEARDAGFGELDP